MLLAFDALVLTEPLGRDVSIGKIIHGHGQVVLKVKTPHLLEEVRKRVGRVAAMLASSLE